MHNISRLSQAALHYCKAHAKINRKIENATPYTMKMYPRKFQLETWHT